MAIVRPDGTEMGCGDLVNLPPNAADVFLVLEIYQEEMSGDSLMNAQKC